MKEIEDIILNYCGFIEGYKNLIKNQGLEESQLMKGKSGEIGPYKYQYHGAGCRLEKEGIVCEYDYLPANEFPIKFSSWKLFEFMDTSVKWKSLNYSLDDIHLSLMELVQQNKLFLLDLDGVKFPIFQIKDINLFR